MAPAPSVQLQRSGCEILQGERQAVEQGGGGVGAGQWTPNGIMYGTCFLEGHAKRWDMKPYDWVMTSHLAF